MESPGCPLLRNLKIYYCGVCVKTTASSTEDRNELLRLRRINSAVYHDFIVKSRLRLVYHRTSERFQLFSCLLCFLLDLDLKGHFTTKWSPCYYSLVLVSFRPVRILKCITTKRFWEMSQCFCPYRESQWASMLFGFLRSSQNLLSCFTEESQRCLEWHEESMIICFWCCFLFDLGLVISFFVCILLQTFVLTVRISEQNRSCSQSL